MNKRITSILLCFAMIIGVLVAAVPVYADEPSSCTFTFEADKTEANPGDTITFTVYMEQQGGINAFEGTVGIPAGLTYVSGVVADGLKDTLGFDDAAWSDDTKYVISGYGIENYTGEAKLKLATFKCTVDSDAAGTYKVGFVSEPPMVAEYLDEDYESYNKNPVCNAVEITVASVHTHVFDKAVATDEHKANDADCTHAATYYMSCECGENGTEVFENGTALGHDFTKKSNTYIHTEAANCQQHVEYWYGCERCGISAEGIDDTKHYSGTVTGEHSFTKKVEDDAHYVAGTGSDCLSVKKYYYNCEYCDEIGTATWNSDEKGPHTWMTDWTPDGADGHYHKCSACGEKKDIESHHPDRPAATETEDQRCVECGYLMQEALGHTHHTAKVDRKEATCTADGNKQYYKCECGEWFEDATANVTIADHSSVVLPATGHDYSVKNSDAAHKRSTAADCRETDTYWYTCANDASHNAKDDAAANDKWYASETAGSHVFDTTKWVDRGNDGHAHKCQYHDAYDATTAHTPDREEATENDPVKCTACGHIITPALGHTHDLGKVEAKPATCTEDGNSEYYKCSGCGKLFADANGTTEITAENTVVRASGHDYQWVTDKAATATETGSKHEECTVCHDKKAAVEIPATGTGTETETGGEKAPQTGDSSMADLWIAIMALSLVCAVGTVVFIRKKHFAE